MLCFLSINEEKIVRQQGKSPVQILDIVSVSQILPPTWDTVRDSRLGENPGPTGSRGNVRLLWIIWKDNRFSDEHQTRLDFSTAVNPDGVNSFFQLFQLSVLFYTVPNLLTLSVLLTVSLVLLS